MVVIEFKYVGVEKLLLEIQLSDNDLENKSTNKNCYFRSLCVFIYLLLKVISNVL